jgi:Amt family ammonium transporter
VVTLAWSGGLSFVLLKLVGLVTPLRSDEQDEWAGMDSSEAGERGYILGDESAFGPSASGHEASPAAVAHAQPRHTTA